MTTAPRLNLRLNLRAAAYAAAFGAALLAAPVAGRAGEIVASLGADDVGGANALTTGLEARTDPLWRPGGRFGVAAAAAFEADGDFWSGAGPVATFALAPRWRLEASVMLGWYAQGGEGKDLGTDFPIFRSQLGASYALADGWRLGASVNHKSNARTADYNPGVETLLLSLAHSF